MLCSDPCLDSDGRVDKEDSGWTISVIGQTWVCLNWYEQLKTNSHAVNWFTQPPTPDSRVLYTKYYTSRDGLASDPQNHDFINVLLYFSRHAERLLTPVIVLLLQYVVI